MLSQAETSSFAPNLARLANLVDSLLKGIVYFLEVLVSTSTLVLQLNEHSPQPTLCKVRFQALLDNLFGVSELTHAHVHHNGLELNFPFSVSLHAYSLHDLEGPLILTNHLEILGVFQKGERDLLQWYLHAGALNAQSRLICVSLILHESGSNEPYLPFHAIRAVSCDDG